MTPSAADALDRRNLSRRVRLWRALAFLALAAVLLTLLWALGGFRAVAIGPYVARVPVSGMVTENRDLVALMKKLGDDDAVRGVVLAVDTPGGTAVGGETIYRAVRDLAEKKPVVASVGTLAASAGYMIAAGTDHIVARNTSIVGSIGVIVQFPQAGRLLERIGVDVEEVKSAPLKGEPSAFDEAPPPEARAMLQRLVDSSYAFFVDLVTERRPLSRTETLRIADGSVFSGMQALDLKLVDELGGEDEAMAWLVRERGVPEGLKLRSRAPADEGATALFSRAADGGWLAGLGAAPGGGEIAAAIGDLAKRARREGLFLDGVLALWTGRMDGAR